MPTTPTSRPLSLINRSLLAALVAASALAAGCGSSSSGGGGGDLAMCADAGEVACCPGGCAAGESCVWNESAMAVCVKSCQRGTDCATGCCAPAVDRAGDLVGPYVCRPNPICCGNGTCPGKQCCAADSRGNTFCAKPCTQTAMCGAGHCRTDYTLIMGNCSEQQVCGP